MVLNYKECTISGEGVTLIPKGPEGLFCAECSTALSQEKGLL